MKSGDYERKRAKLSTMATKTAEKQAVFVREYLIDRNGTRAAIAAGYAPRSASVTSCRLLRNAKVHAEVSQLTEEKLERLEITTDTVLQELAKIAFANMKDYLSVRDDGSVTVDISQVTAGQAAALSDLRIDEYVSEKGRIRCTRLKLSSATSGRLGRKRVMRLEYRVCCFTICVGLQRVTCGGPTSRRQ